MLQRSTDQLPTQLSSRRYVLITPCRDEAAFARRTLESVAAQTVPPALWIVVDDGSRDATPQILAEYAARLPYLKVIHITDRGFRKLGGGVVDAFYEGYATINPNEFEFLCKLDLDVELPPRYFENLIERMERNPRIGTCSGKPLFLSPAGRWIRERCGDENSVGMAKFYRTTCFRQIGGFVRELMWDGVDGHRCRMLGWIAVSWDDPQINFRHLRPMGKSDRGWWRGRVRHGIGQYYMGTGPLYLVASAVSRLPHPPPVIGSAGILWGYIKSALAQRDRYCDQDFRRFLRQFQHACLLLGKRRAIERLDRQRAPFWNPAILPRVGAGIEGPDNVPTPRPQITANVL